MTCESMIERTGKRENAVAQPEGLRGGRVFAPQVDIVEGEHELLLLADVPGVKSEDVEVSYEQGLLTLHARVHPRQDEEQTRFVVREYGVGDFYRSFQIGEGIDPQKIEAHLKDGVLTLHLPKAEAAKPRRIKVNSN